MISVVRRLSFCAGHRVANHESKCRNLHGHQYEIEIHATADNLDQLGRIVDFGVIKDTVGQWIDDKLDHGFLVWGQDTEALKALGQIDNQKLFVMTANPTAENIAMVILTKANDLLAQTSSQVTVFKVVCHETPNCRAEVDQ